MARKGNVDSDEPSTDNSAHEDVEMQDRDDKMNGFKKFGVSTMRSHFITTIVVMKRMYDPSIAQMVNIICPSIIKIHPTTQYVYCPLMRAPEQELT